MDEECTELLGRPISSLKVTELRDELARRALIKTGNKKELIDRLRQTLLKESQPVATDLSIQTTSEPYHEPISQNDQEMEPSAIDYSSPAKSETQNASAQNNNLNVSKHEDGTVSLDSDVVNQASVLHGDTKESQSEPEIEQHDDCGVLAQQSTKIQKEQESPITEGLDSQLDKEAGLDYGGELKSINDQPESSIAPDVTPEPNHGSVDAIDTTQSAAQSEPMPPLSFTLKRGISDNLDGNSNRNEKKRKWSGKSECGQSDSAPPTVLPSGISSQKLQELIDIKHTESTKSIGNTQNAEYKKDKKQAAKEERAKKSDNSKDDLASAASVPTSSQEDKTTDDATVAEGIEVSAKEPEVEKEPTNGISISNLVRPFTVLQLKEELTKFGALVEEKFWINKVKSRCCVIYESVDVAKQAKESLHGVNWPLSNPKTLQISYITDEEYEHIKTFDDMKKVDSTVDNAVNGKGTKSDHNADRAEGDDVLVETTKKRSNEKTSGQVNTKSSQVNRDGDNTQSQELDDLFKKTKSKPPLFYLPLTEEQAEVKQKLRREREVREQETEKSKKSTAPHRRPSPPRKRSPPRRSPQRHRSPRRGSSRNRSPPNRRPPTRRRTPPRDSPPHRRRSPTKNSPPARKRSPNPRISPNPDRQSRRSPGPNRRSPGPLRRSSGPQRRSPGVTRRSPKLIHRSPGPGRRSPGPIRRSPGPIRRSPGPLRRSPGPLRRSPGPPRRSPGQMRRSPAQSRRSPGPIRRSPGPIRRSPGPIRRSPGPIRRSPGPIRRSPGPIRRSPGPMRRSPGPLRRSPGLSRRSPGPVRRPPMLQTRSPGPPSPFFRRSRSRSPIRRRSPMRRRSKPRSASPGSDAGYRDTRRADRFDRVR